VAALRALISLPWALGCGAAAPPSEAEYPSLVLPAQLPSPRQPAGASTKAAASPTARPGSPETAGSAGAERTRPAGTLAAGDDASDLNSTRRFGEHGDLPDPEPLSQRARWSYPIVYDRGQIRVGQPEPMCLPRPQPTPRRIGRFAFELWVGRELIDRVRFDFPLLASEEPPTGPRRPLRETPRFAPGAHVSVTLGVPASERASAARILDRATGESIAVTWPPRSPDGVTRPHPCPPAAPAVRAVANPPGPTDAGR